MKTYKLKYPVEWDGSKVTELEIRRPKGKHIKRMGANADLGAVMGIAANVTDFTPKFFDELDAADYIGISEVIGDFLDVGQTTGES